MPLPHNAGMDSLVYSFPPLASPDAHTLILGSMPGLASLQAGQYYAHPRNAFWPILADIAGFDSKLDYPLRVQALQSAGIAVWDVLRSCRREGSADARILRDSEQANDFTAFFRQHQSIRCICFNGQTAARAWRHHVLAHHRLPSVPCHVLPSTSPAHARLGLDDKLHQWRDVLTPMLGGTP